MFAPPLVRDASSPAPCGGLVASSRRRALRGRPRVVVACSRDDDASDANRKGTTTTFRTRARCSSLAAVSTFFAAAPSRAAESIAFSDAALVDRVRAWMGSL